MNFRYYLFILFFICSCAITDIDIEEKKVNHGLSLSTYYYIVENQMEINLNINIKYQDLVFKKNEDFFSSEIILHVKVLDDDGNIVYSHASNEEVSVQYYDETISNEVSNFNYDFLLPIGNYDIYLSIDDYENHKSWNLVDQIEFDSEKFISDIEFLYSDNRKLHRIYENELFQELDTIWVRYQIRDDEFGKDSIYFQIKSSDYIKNENSKDEKNLNQFLQTEKYQIHQIPINISEIKSNYIIANIMYKEQIKSKELKLFKIKKQDIDYYRLIGPMEYVLSIEEYIDYTDLDTLEKINFTEKYWKDKYNKNLLNEFYDRIIYADNSFSLFLEKGWNSDRGKIYITYGKPANVSYDFNDSGEFEIWTYKNRRFVFINRYGIFELYNEFN